MIQRLIGAITLAVFLTIPLMISCAQKQGQQENKSGQVAQTNQVNQGAAKSTPGLPIRIDTTTIPQTSALGFVDVEKRVTDTLLAVWQFNGIMTSVDQAGKILGLAVTDSMRAELLKKFENNLSMSKRLNHYRPYTFILNNQEKLIGQYIMIHEKKDQEFPELKRIATDLKIPEAKVSERLKFLASIGFLYPLGGVDEYNKLGYSYGGNASDFTFDMGLRFHQFTVDNQPPFNVGCAKEAFFVVAAEYPNNQIRYDTVDPLTLAPIEVVFKDKQVVSVSPDSACFLEGGSCGTNNLFASREDATAWAKAQPQIGHQAPPISGIAETLQSVISELNNSATGGK